MASIQLVLQIPGGIRIDLPGQWGLASSLADVVKGVSLADSAGEAVVRYLNTKVPQSQWSTTTLQQIGLTQGGRALLTLEYSTQQPPTVSATIQQPLAASNILEQALATIFQNNFDADTKVCLVTMIKILDKILQQPGNEKVRSIRLSNAAFSEKVGIRPGAIEFLLACGFSKRPAPTPLLAKLPTPGDDYLVLPSNAESTSHLIAARQLLATRAVQDLGMTADDLPTYKPPPAQPTGVAKRPNPSPPGAQFDPFRGHRVDFKSAAVGARLGPEDNYESPTEHQLQKLQSQQKKLEEAMQQKLKDRELVATLPSSSTPAPSSSPSSTSISHPSSRESDPSDAGLLAARQQRLDEERRQREEGGFTTKAMRDLEQLKKAKVYSHVHLRVQFRDGSAVHGKFLPKETLAKVKEVVASCFCVDGLDFDLYVAPPRRVLDYQKTLQEEGLVPAAKIMASWKVAGTPLSHAGVGSFLKPELFRQGEAVQAYPTSTKVANEGKSSTARAGTAVADDKPAAVSKEEALLQRMMGGGKSGTSKGPAKFGSAKPKWFKG